MKKFLQENDTQHALRVKGKAKWMELRHKLCRFFGEFEIGFYRDRALWIAEGGQRREAFLRFKNSEGWHIFMRPAPSREPYFLLADDISAYRLVSQHSDASGSWRSGRTVVETSPDNFQVWIRSRHPLTPEQKLYWLRKMGSDPGAAPRGRWGRMPGFRNRKEKYLCSGNYPLSRLIWIDFRRPADVPVPVISDDRIICTEPFPVPAGRGRVSSGGAVCRSDYDCGDQHRTDFRFCLALIRRGFSDSEISERLVSERADWENHKGDRRMTDYLKRTLRRARLLCR